MQGSRRATVSIATIGGMKTMKRTMLAGLVWMLGVTAQAANTVQVDVTGTKTWDPLFPSVSGTTFTDPSRTGFMLDVLTHGPAGGSTVIVAGKVAVVTGTSFNGSGVAPYVQAVPGSPGTTAANPAFASVATGTSFNGSGVAPAVSVPSGVDIASGTSFKGSGVAPVVVATQSTGVVFSVSNTGDIHGVVGPLSRSTTGTPVFMANAGEITYTIVQTGALTGVTVFTDVSNQDTAPASVTGLAAEASEWQTLTPNGNITTAAGGALLGQSPANTFIASGYRWMRWRIEGMANVSNVTLHVMYKARIP